MKGERIYHIMVDRFFPSKEEDSNGNFKGGSLRSIIDNLDYIQELGMTGIMLTPLYKTAAYHGYHIVDFEQIVDDHFGTTDDLVELVEKVHERGMKIVVDFVANHCHRSCSLFSDGKHKDWFIVNRDGENRGFANISDLPMFNTKNRAVQKYLTQKALSLCDFGIDAIRLDHATGPCYSFWKYFKKNIKKKYPDVILIGEVWGRMDFKPRNYFRYFFNRLRYDDQEARQLEYVKILDGVLDFKYQQLLCDAVRNDKSVVDNFGLREKLKLHFARYPTDFQLWLFLDNHDMNRFLFECQGDKNLLLQAIDYSKKWDKTFLMYYGTEKYMINKEDVFSGIHYADEQVRECLI